MMWGTSTVLQTDDAMPDVSVVPGPNIAATPSLINSQTDWGEKCVKYEYSYVINKLELHVMGGCMWVAKIEWFMHL